MLAFAGALGMAQRRQDGHGGVHAGEQVRHRHAHFLRPSADVIALAGDAHQATHALDGIVVAGALAVRPGLAETGHAAVDQTRVQRFQAVVVQAVARHVTDLEVLHEHVAMLHQVADQRLPLRLRDIAGDRPLVPVRTEVIGRLGRIVAGTVLQERRAPGAGVIPCAGTLDLDHIGAQVCQCLGAPRAGQHAGQIEDTDAIK